MISDNCKIILSINFLKVERSFNVGLSSFSIRSVLIEKCQQHIIFKIYIDPLGLGDYDTNKKWFITEISTNVE